MHLVPARTAARSAVAVAVTLAALLTAGCGASNGAAEASAAVAAARSGAALAAVDRVTAPTIEGELLDGSPFSSADLRGQVVVLNFWGSWCGPCRAEAPALQQAYVATQPLGVAFVGIDVRDQKPLAEAFVRAKGLTYPSLFDPSGAIALTLRATPPNATPATVVLDRDHRVAAVWPGPVAVPTLEAVVRAVAAEQP